jgi:hypothetical protein
MVLIHAMAFFWRSYLEYVEGEESAGKYLDKDVMGDEGRRSSRTKPIPARPKRRDFI